MQQRLFDGWPISQVAVRFTGTHEVPDEDADEVKLDRVVVVVLAGMVGPGSVKKRPSSELQLVEPLQVMDFRIATGEMRKELIDVFGLDVGFDLELLAPVRDRPHNPPRAGAHPSQDSATPAPDIPGSQPGEPEEQVFAEDGEEDAGEPEAEAEDWDERAEVARFRSRQESAEDDGAPPPDADIFRPTEGMGERVDTFTQGRSAMETDPHLRRVMGDDRGWTRVGD